MDKMVRKIIVAVVVVLLLVAAYIAVSVIPNQLEEKNIKEIKAQKGDIVVMSTALDYVDSINVSNSSGAYTFVKNDNSWTVKEYPEYDFELSAIQSAIYDLSNFNALEEVDLPENPADYGFDKPVSTLTIELVTAEKREFLLGNQVKGGRGDFLLDKTNNKAYVVSVYMADGLTKDVSSFRKKTLFSISSGQVKEMEITNASGKIAMELLPSSYSSELEMTMTYPTENALDETVANNIFSAISDITVIEFVNDNGSNLAKYGLDKPILTIDIVTPTDNVTIKYGNKDGKGNVYSMLGGSKLVFTQSSTLYDNCVNISQYNLMNKFVNIVNIGDVASVTIEGKGIKHILDIKSGDDFYIDGKSAENDAFREVYQEIIGIKGSGLATENVANDTEYVIEFAYKNGESSRYEYASYDDLNYYVECNGERKFITLKNGFNNMIKAVEKLAKNPKG